MRTKLLLVCSDVEKIVIFNVQELCSRWRAFTCEKLGGLSCWATLKDDGLYTVKKAFNVLDIASTSRISDEHDGAKQVLITLLGFAPVPHQKLNMSQVICNGHCLHETIILRVLHDGVGQLVKCEGFL